MVTDRRTLLKTSGLAAAALGLDLFDGLQVFAQEPKKEEPQSVALCVPYLTSPEDLSALEKLIANCANAADFFYCVAAVANHVVYGLPFQEFKKHSELESATLDTFVRASVSRCLGPHNSSFADILPTKLELPKEGLATLENVNHIKRTIALGELFLNEKKEPEKAFVEYRNALLNLKRSADLVRKINNTCPEVLVDANVRGAAQKVKQIEIFLKDEIAKYRIEQNNVVVRSDFTEAWQSYVCVTPFGEFSFSRTRTFRPEESAILRINPYLLADWREDLFTPAEFSSDLSIWDLVHHEVYYGKELDSLRVARRGRFRQLFYHVTHVPKNKPDLETNLREASYYTAEESRKTLLVGLDAVFRGKTPDSLRDLKDLRERSADIMSPNIESFMDELERRKTGADDAGNNWRKYVDRPQGYKVKEANKRLADWERSIAMIWTAIYQTARPTQRRIFSMPLPNHLRGNNVATGILQSYYDYVRKPELQGEPLLDTWHRWSHPNAADGDEVELELLFRGFEQAANGRMESVVEIYKAEVKGHTFLFPVQRNLSSKEIDRMAYCPALYDILRVPLAFVEANDVFELLPGIADGGPGEIIPRLKSIAKDTNPKQLLWKVQFSVLKPWITEVNQVVKQADTDLKAHWARVQQAYDDRRRAEKEQERRGGELGEYYRGYEQYLQERAREFSSPLIRMTPEERAIDDKIVRSLAAAVSATQVRGSTVRGSSVVGTLPPTRLPRFEDELRSAGRVVPADYGKVVRNAVDKFESSARSQISKASNDRTLCEIIRDAETWKQQIVDNVPERLKLLDGLQKASDALGIGGTLVPPKAGGTKLGMASFAIDVSMIPGHASIAKMNDQLTRLSDLQDKANTTLIGRLNAKGITTNFSDVNDLVHRFSTLEREVTTSLANHPLNKAMQSLEEQARRGVPVSGDHAAGVLGPHIRDYQVKFVEVYNANVADLVRQAPNVLKGASAQESVLRRHALLQRAGSLLESKGDVPVASWYDRYGISRVAEDLIGLAIPYKLGVVILVAKGLAENSRDPELYRRKMDEDMRLRLDGLRAVARKGISDTTKEIEPTLPTKIFR